MVDYYLNHVLPWWAYPLGLWVFLLVCSVAGNANLPKTKPKVKARAKTDHKKQHKAHEQANQQQHRQTHSQGVKTQLENALGLLGLSLVPFPSESEIKKAYKSAMKCVHPDLPNGSEVLAKCVNQAHDLIMKELKFRTKRA